MNKIRFISLFYRYRWRLLKWEQAKAFYSEIAIVRESVTITCVWQKLKRQAEEWENFKVDKRDSDMSWLEAFSNGESIGGLTMWLAWDVYLTISSWFQVGSRGEIMKLQLVIIFWQLGAISTGITVWLLGLVATNSSLIFWTE